MVHLAGIAGLHDQSDLGAGALPDEVVVHSGDGEQRRDRCADLVGLPIREDEDPGAVGDGGRGRRPDAVERPVQAVAVLGHRV